MSGEEQLRPGPYLRMAVIAQHVERGPDGGVLALSGLGFEIHAERLPAKVSGTLVISLSAGEAPMPETLQLALYDPHWKVLTVTDAALVPVRAGGVSEAIGDISELDFVEYGIHRFVVLLPGGSVIGVVPFTVEPVARNVVH